MCGIIPCRSLCAPLQILPYFTPTDVRTEAKYTTVHTTSTLGYFRAGRILTRPAVDSAPCRVLRPGSQWVRHASRSCVSLLVLRHCLRLVLRSQARCDPGLQHLWCSWRRVSFAHLSWPLCAQTRPATFFSAAFERRDKRESLSHVIMFMCRLQTLF